VYKRQRGLGDVYKRQVIHWSMQTEKGALALLLKDVSSKWDKERNSSGCIS
jgi:hypothetical protein